MNIYHFLNNKKKLIVFFSLGVLSVLPMITLAAAPDPETWFKDVTQNFLDIVVWPVFFGASVLMFIFAGFLFLTAQGDPSKISTAKKAALWAIIGIIVAIVAFSAVNIIKKILGV